MSMATSSAELSLGQASTLMVIYSIIYVLPLYVSDESRPSFSRSRDDPAAIRARVRAVTLSTTACSATTFVILYWLSRHGPALHLMGYWPICTFECLRALLLTATLFAGPLYESLVVDQGWQYLRVGLHAIWKNWAEWRNIVAGPVTEECLFRSAVVPLLLLAKATPSSIIFMSPLVFGVAHIHHFYEFRITHPTVPLHAAIARTILQLGYTTLFGAYATFLFLRTGSLLAVILIHAFCNSLGLPRVWGYMRPYWLPLTASKTTLLKWTAPYYLLLVGGSMLWWRNIFSLTDSPMSLLK